MQQQPGSEGGAETSIPPIAWDEANGLRLYGIKATPEVC